MTLRWKRDSRTGDHVTEDGRFSISPQYFSCVNPRSYELTDHETNQTRTFDLVRDAKQAADHIINPPEETELERRVREALEAGARVS